MTTQVTFKRKLLKLEGFSSSCGDLAFDDVSQADHLSDLLKLQSGLSVGSSLNCSDMHVSLDPMRIVAGS